VRIEKKLITKISSYTPKDTVVNADGEIVDVIPQNETQVYLTFEDGSRQRVLWLDSEQVDNRKLFTYYPTTESKTVTSRDVVVGMAAKVVEYEVLT
jgi:hypothetical protein